MEYEIKLTQQDLQIIYQGLGELPMKIALNLFGKLQQEQQQQDAAKAMPLNEIQRQFDESVDRRDMPSGAPAP